MHWDPTISIGNVLTAVAMIAGMLLAFNRHSIAAMKLAASMEANSNATNNARSGALGCRVADRNVVVHRTFLHALSSQCR